MNLYLYIIFAAVSFLASVAGAICGIGGGVLIKPILDAFGVLSVSTISFLSSCTVLSMSCYSVVKAKLSGSSLVDIKTGTPLAIGAALGGVAGKLMFQYLSNLAENKNQVGAVQALCLLVITLGTLIYTLKKDMIHTHHVSNHLICILIGLVLGIFSSFLGIGGGPINLVVLFFFFSMDTKTAAQNSLYIILFSQIASLINTLATGNVPEFGIELLVIMVLCGILGGAAGRIVNRRMEASMVNQLFIGLMVVIMLICVYNIIQFI
ncbi:MAG: sulfite exporter TauE/SafE family protein [Hungatella sp.]|nr:sulfite exporter TauE/SafE family protein [Hungatella sp.]